MFDVYTKSSFVSKAADSTAPVVVRLLFSLVLGIITVPVLGFLSALFHPCVVLLLPGLIVVPLLPHAVATHGEWFPALGRDILAAAIADAVLYSVVGFFVLGRLTSD